MKLIRNRSFTAWIVAAVAIVSPALAQGQGALITGKVTSSAGDPLASANVYINDLKISVATTQAGTYTIAIPEARLNKSTVNLRVRAIGYAPDVKEITLNPGAQTINFTLRRDVNRLAEVVVTGVTGETEQTKVAFSVARVDAAELEKVPSANPLTALSGKVAGANIVSWIQYRLNQNHTAPIR